MTENAGSHSWNLIHIYSDQHLKQDIHLTGGKGSNLFRLVSHGFRVPSFVVLPASALLAQIELSPESTREECIKAIEAIQIPESILDAIRSNIPNTKFFAVRSSAVDEDGGQFSFAGQFESHLFVSEKEIIERIEDVWKSAFSERVIAYRKQNGLPIIQPIAVVIQAMIESESAGVGFGINPTSGSRNERIISSVWGLGEGLVSGELDADTFVVKGKNIESTIARKERQVKWKTTGGSGTELVELESSKRNSSSLENNSILQIANTLDELSSMYGRPQDIEFAMYQNELYLLQARPITNLNLNSDKSGEHIIWDNSNIIESYPGVTTPLTFSFIIRMYEAVYIQLSALLGVRQHEIDKNKEVFANMLGLIQGRVYYNLLSWYKALAMLPGYSLNAGFMEKMMGVKERFELKDFEAGTKFQERMRVVRMIRTMLRNLRQLPKMRIDFQREFNEIMTEYDAIDLDLKKTEELMELYLRFEQTLLKKWKAPLVNDFFAMIFFGVTQKLTEKYNLPSGIHNDLLCGAKDIISTEPIRLSLALSTAILKDEKAKALFISEEPFHVWKKLEEVSPLIKKQFNEYIQKFGERCVGELKLETITYKQDPASFVRIIQGYVRQGVVEGKEHNLDEKMRSDAEEKVDKALRGKWLKKMIFSYFLKRARILVSARENLRFERTRGFGKVREIFCAIGRKFYFEGIIDDARDIFYLTKEEIFDFIKGTAVTQDVRSLIQLRKDDYTKWSEMRTSERIHTYGMVYHGNPFYQEFSKEELTGDLKGLGCCPGRVKARVQVVRDPREVEDLNGDILVTSSTDPGWVTLFPTASAILVERGSLLSHSAIVSREMGKPCIVGITGLLDRLKTGDIVEMDGSTGVVQIIEQS
jgi:phosphohistidine swiveling domain-containing protein